jgi:hypothetical protein
MELVHTYEDYQGDVFEYQPYKADEGNKEWTKIFSDRKMKQKEWNAESEKWSSNGSLTHGAALRWKENIATPCV